jgi:hypothetical protein
MDATVSSSTSLHNSYAHATIAPDYDGSSEPVNLKGGAARNCTVQRVLVIAKDELVLGAAAGNITVRVAPAGAGAPVPLLRAGQDPERLVGQQHAMLYRLTAPALNSTSNVVWANQSWDGTATGLPTSGVKGGEVLVMTGAGAGADGSGEYLFTMPPLSAALVVVKSCS